jgi:hypothetical protein
MATPPAIRRENPSFKTRHLGVPALPCLYGCVSKRASDYRLQATSYWLHDGASDSSDITLMREPDGAVM